MRALLLSFLLLSCCPAYAQLEYNLTPGITPVSHDIYNLHMTVIWVCVGIGVVVFGAMIYAMIFHRKSRGSKPAKFHEHLWLELTWTIIPFLILIGLAIPGTKVLSDLNDTAKPDLTIKITGYQWKWRYEYLENGISFFSNLSTPLDERNGKVAKNPNYLREVDNPLVLPTHKKVRFLMTSNDVIHAWWVPELGVKRDGVPGYITESWARLNRPGTYRGQCVELCGVNHAFMPIVVIAKSEKEFNDWVQQKKGGAPASVTANTGTVSTTSTTVSPDTTKPGTGAASTTSSTASPNAIKPETGVTATASSTASPNEAKPDTTPKVLPSAAQPPTSPAPVQPQPIATLSKDDLMKKGEQIYMTTCSACHQPTGEGMPPLYPALKGGAITKGPIAAHINIVLNGKPGTAMQPFKDQFSDDEIAAIITYERNAWGNNTGDIVQPSQITAAKSGSAP